MHAHACMHAHTRSSVHKCAHMHTVLTDKKKNLWFVKKKIPIETIKRGHKKDMY